MAEQALEERDGFGLREADLFEVIADSDARVLLMELPITV